MIAPGTALGPRLLATHYEPPGSSSGKQQDQDAITDAEKGSDTLCRHLLLAFRKFEREHRLRPGEGQFLLLHTGVRL